MHQAALPEEPSSIRLYAVVPAEEAFALRARRSFSILSCGAAAALCGRPPRGGDRARAAFWHDRVVGLALESCTAVVPFRLGMDFETETEMRATLRLNAPRLAEQLERFRGRIEMGLKVRIPAPTADQPLRLPSGLESVRALAPEPADRWERLGRSPQGNVFEGCYLVSRRAIEDFWQAVEGIRRSSPELPLLGSGPWAPYSFCETPLQRGPSQAAEVLSQKGRHSTAQKCRIHGYTEESALGARDGGSGPPNRLQEASERNHS